MSRLTGTEYPAEIHFVHWNTKVNNDVIKKIFFTEQLIDSL